MAHKSKDRKKRRGPRGAVGKPGAPGIAPKEIHTIIENIEQIQVEATIQFKRIAQIQMQMDETLKALKDMGERAGRQRKKR